MTAIRGYVAPTTETGALGVYPLDQFVLAVPDVNVAQGSTAISSSISRATATR